VGAAAEAAVQAQRSAGEVLEPDEELCADDTRSAVEKPYIASMGIYVMTATALKELLEEHMPDANDFGNEVIPGARKLGYPVQVMMGTPGGGGSLQHNRALQQKQVCCAHSARALQQKQVCCAHSARALQQKQVCCTSECLSADTTATYRVCVCWPAQHTKQPD
jgi:hypothetical protein